jgi:biopolymer transport protein TolQ
MLQRIVPKLAAVLGICAFISITMYSVYLNAMPQYVIECTGCINCPPGENCRCLPTEDICLWGMVQKMSWITLLAYMALYILLCYAIAVVVERWLTYYYAERQTREFRLSIGDAIYGNRLDEARGMAAGYPKSPLAAVVNASLHPDQSVGAWARRDTSPSMEARQQAMVIKTEELRRGLWKLSAVGWTIPLIGFFILVAGVINLLQGLKYTEGLYSPYLAGPLADALWATIFSILTGIPVIWFHKYFAAKLQMRLTEMDRLSLAIISQIANPPEAIMARGSIKQYDTQPLDVRATHRFRD